MRDCGKKTALEVVAYTKDECLAGARLAADCGVDLLMGTFYFPEIRDLCRRKDIRYFPFVGRVRARPSILEGSAAGMLDIVAVHSQTRGRMFLPFADDDPKTAEILSKILLLARK